ncbi:MAG TPA: hypothetical protein PLW40_01050 [Syntrophales bacterium]|nr:hypothetical protein [Syntrophales bacterium]
MAEGSREGAGGLWVETAAFLALFFDNVGSLVFLSSLLVFTFNYPAEIVVTRMIPGTAVGVFLGDLVYTFLALRLRRRTGRADVTAMPLGIDTPSTIGLALAVLGPTYVATGDAWLTWHVGMGTLFLIGVVKVVAAFGGEAVRRVVPTAGLLGPLAGIGLLMLSFLPLLEIFASPIVGLVALGLSFSVLLGKVRLPGRLPGVLLAVLAGTVIHLLLGYAGMLPEFHPPRWEVRASLPWPSVAFLGDLHRSLPFLPLAVPFGIMTIVGGINNAHSARLAGDDYRTRDILLTEAVTSLVAPFFGGVAQTTPYIGHPAYKRMGATHWYTAMTALMIGLASVAGLLSLLCLLIPQAALAPIFLFIGFEIVRQAFAEAPPGHAEAVSISMLPAAAVCVMIVLNQFLGALPPGRWEWPAHLKVVLASLTTLSNGFIVTGVLWGTMTAFLIEGRTGKAALCALLGALMTPFGLIHSVRATGEVYLPWRVEGSAHLTLAAGYLVLAAVWLAAGRGRKDKDRGPL